jgi:hypothetical protein
MSPLDHLNAKYASGGTKSKRAEAILTFANRARQAVLDSGEIARSDKTLNPYGRQTAIQRDTIPVCKELKLHMASLESMRQAQKDRGAAIRVKAFPPLDKSDIRGAMLDMYDLGRLERMSAADALRAVHQNPHTLRVAYEASQRGLVSNIPSDALEMAVQAFVEATLPREVEALNAGQEILEIVGASLEIVANTAGAALEMPGDRFARWLKDAVPAPDDAELGVDDSELDRLAAEGAALTFDQRHRLMQKLLSSQDGDLERREKELKAAA